MTKTKESKNKKVQNVEQHIEQNDEFAFSDVVCAGDLLRHQIKDIPYLVQGIIPQVGLIGLVGSSDLGKSTILQQLILNVCSGEDFLGWKTSARYKRAIYVSSEDDVHATNYRLRKQNKSLNYPLEVFDRIHYIYSSEDLERRIVELISKQRVDIIIIDAFSDFFAGSLYETNKVRGFLQTFQQIAQQFSLAIVFLHHTNKRSDSLAPSKHNALGSQGFESKLRLMFELKKDILDDDLRHLCIVKGNYLSAEYKNRSFVLRFNEDMIFENTGVRKHFDVLGKSKEYMDNVEGEHAEIQELLSAGLSQKEIAEKLGVKQPTISRRIKNYNNLKIKLQ